MFGGTLYIHTWIVAECYIGIQSCVCLLVLIHSTQLHLLHAQLSLTVDELTQLLTLLLAVVSCDLSS